MIRNAALLTQQIPIDVRMYQYINASLRTIIIAEEAIEIWGGALRKIILQKLNSCGEP